MNDAREGVRTKVASALSSAGTLGKQLNAFSAIHHVRAEAELQRLFERSRWPMLAGKTFGVKNLYDLNGEITLAGSVINRDDPPASSDAPLVRRMCDAGAVLIGSHHMGEYAYDFTGENKHYGATLNPHDIERMSGGSSGGSASAVASGIVDIALASDTNGSIRLPASLCGIYGLRPTAGRFPSEGTFPFCHTLDQLGPLTRSLEDLALFYDAMSQGAHAGDDARERLNCNRRPEGLRVGRLRGWFDDLADEETRRAVDQVSLALDAIDITLPEIEKARAAAFIITNAEGGAMHAERLRQRAGDYDPDTRDRFIAGSLLPAEWYIRAQRYRQHFTSLLERIFDDFDVLIAPSSPVAAPLIGQRELTVGGRIVLLRANLGLFTQPLSLAGLPILAAPVARSTGLPRGVQIMGGRHRELDCFWAAGIAYRRGAIGTPRPAMFAS